MFDPVLIVAFIALAATVWSIVTFSLARITGWSRLSKRYRQLEEYTGELFPFQTIKLHKFGFYFRCASIGANKLGLFIRPVRILCPSHDTLFIPWDQIQVAPDTVHASSDKIVFVLAKPKYTLALDSELAKKLLSHCPRKTLGALSKQTIIRV